MTCLNLANSEILPGLAFDENEGFRALADDPTNYPMLLYPCEGAFDLSAGAFPKEILGGRNLVIFLIDATWACAKSIIKASPGLLDLPKLKFSPREKSRWLIKRQPADYCLSTLEATHELLLALEAAGLDAYPDKTRLLETFARMQNYQIERAAKDGKPRFIQKSCTVEDQQKKERDSR